LTTYVVKQLELALRARVDRVAAAEGLTGLQYTALVALRAEPAMSSAELSRRSGVSPQAASEMIAGLEAKGLLSRTPRPDNRRVLEIHLTKDAAERLARCDAAMAEVDAAMTSDLTGAESRQLRDLIDRCLATLRSIP